MAQPFLIALFYTIARPGKRLHSIIIVRHYVDKVLLHSADIFCGDIVATVGRFQDLYKLFHLLDSKIEVVMQVDDDIMVCHGYISPFYKVPRGGVRIVDNTTFFDFRRYYRRHHPLGAPDRSLPTPAEHRPVDRCYMQ